MFEFKLPDLGEGIHEGEILKWHVAEGDRIDEDAPLVDVETDKAAVTIPSPKRGTLVSRHGQIGAVVKTGEVIAVIDDAGERVATPPQRPAATSPVVAPSPEPAAISSGSRPPAAPATRRLARELGIDINLVPATGPGGRVTPEDVQRFAAGPAPEAQLAAAPAIDTPAQAERSATESHAAEAEYAAHAATAIPFLDIEPLPDFSQWGPVEIETLRSIRRKVAHKMVTSKVLIPHVAHMDEADVTLLEDFRIKERQRRAGGRGERLTLLAFVIKAITAGLKAAPAFNASLDPFKEQIIYKRYYNIGFAADTGRGLVVPVIREADRMSILSLSEKIASLADAARAGTLESADLRGGTFTITNVGPLGGTALIPAVNYPEVAILGMGRAQEKPVVRDGQIVIRKMLPLTLAFDHRVADGADAARFVTELVRMLSDPHALLLET